jgi:hypothetical protein
MLHFPAAPAPLASSAESTSRIYHDPRWDNAAAVRGQSTLDGFDPSANGLIRVVVVQPMG